MSLFNPGLEQICDSNGGPISGATWNFYDSGTTTPRAVYSDADYSASLGATVTASSSGRCVPIYLNDDYTYRAVLKDATGVTIRDIDPVQFVDQPFRNTLAGTTGASLVGTDNGTTVQEYLDTLASGYAPAGPRMDLFFHYGQSLTVARGSIITDPAEVVPTLYTFNGGAEYAFFDDPTSGSVTSWPAHPQNFETLENFVPYSAANKESHAAGFGYQSAQGPAARSLYFSPGYGGQSARLLRPGNTFWCGFSYGIYRAVKLARAMGYEPIPHIIWDQGHAQCDTFTDGGTGGETETTSADYQTACGKIFAEMRRAVSYALGTPWTGPIWVAPLLTGQGAANVYSLTGRKNIIAAQLAMQSANVRLLPAWSQWVSTANCESDGVHPAGGAIRYRAETFAAYILNGNLRPPKMLSKAVVGSTVEVTFDQPVAISSRVLDGSSLNGMKGFEIYDNTGASKTINSVTAHSTDSTKIVITPANTTNLSGSWYVRAGLHQTTTGQATLMFPRTFVKGAIDVGTTEDGTTIENIQIPQEI